MTKTYTGTIESKSWDESSFIEVENGPQIKNANGIDLYHGDLEAEAKWSGVVVYKANGTGSFTSMQNITGKVDGRSGSFVLQVNGSTDETGMTKGVLSIVPGSQTGDLTTLNGNGNFQFQYGGESSYTLDCTFE